MVVVSLCHTVIVFADVCVVAVNLLFDIPGSYYDTFECIWIVHRVISLVCIILRQGDLWIFCSEMWWGSQCCYKNALSGYTQRSAGVCSVYSIREGVGSPLSLLCTVVLMCGMLGFCALSVGVLSLA